MESRSIRKAVQPTPPLWCTKPLDPNTRAKTPSLKEASFGQWGLLCQEGQLKAEKGCQHVPAQQQVLSCTNSECQGLCNARKPQSSAWPCSPPRCQLHKVEGR